MTEIKKLYKQLVLKKGADHQKIVCIEECSELQKELTKNIRGEHNSHHIAEEIADVQIMCEQMIELFGIEDLVQEWTDLKINKIKKMVGNTNEVN